MPYRFHHGHLRQSQPPHGGQAAHCGAADSSSSAARLYASPPTRTAPHVMVLLPVAHLTRPGAQQGSAYALCCKKVVAHFFFSFARKQERAISRLATTSTAANDKRTLGTAYYYRCICLCKCHSSEQWVNSCYPCKCTASTVRLISIKCTVLDSWAHTVSTSAPLARLGSGGGSS